MPESLPARPRSVTTKRPSPSLRVRIASSPAVSSSPTSLAAIVVKVSPASVVVCSIAKSPVRVWPATVRLTSLPAIRRNGPAVRFKAIKSSPTITVSLTAAFVVLIATMKLPLNSIPGIATATSPSSSPATPAAVEMNAPLASVTLTVPPPTLIFTPLAPITRLDSIVIGSII